MPCAGALKHIYASGGRSIMPRMQVQRALVSVCLLLEESVKSCARGGESSLLETDPAPAAGQRLAGDGAQRCRCAAVSAGASSLRTPWADSLPESGQMLPERCKAEALRD